MLEHAYNNITYQSVGSQRHFREVFDGLSYTDKRFLSMFSTTVQMPGAESY